MGESAPDDVSVVIPARDAASTIGNTLASLATEAAVIHEVIVVDDGSTDGTGEVAASEAGRHNLPLRIVETDAGDAAAARNTGLDIATGRYVYFIDADDLHLSGGLRALVDALAADEATGMALGGFRRITSTGYERGKRAARVRGQSIRNAERLLADRAGTIAVGSVLLRATAIGGARFPERLAYDEDTLFWAEIMARVGVAAVDDKILAYQLDLDRSDQRFLTHARPSFLRWLQAARRLEAVGVRKEAIRARAEIIALKIARTHYAHLGGAQGRKFIDVARRIWKPGDATLRLLRYRRKIAALERDLPVGFEGGRSPGSAVLQISVDPFNPPVSGVDLRNMQIATCLAETGSVTVASVHPIGSEAIRNAEGPIVTTSLTRLGDAKGAPVSRRRTYIDPRLSRQALRRLRTLMRLLRPETVIVEGIQLWPLLKPLRKLAPKLVLDMHNVESHLATSLGASRRWSTWFLDQAAMIARRERAAARIVDRIWVCSPDDQARLVANGLDDNLIRVVPNGIPRFDLPGRLPDREPPDVERLNLLFVGHLGYAPNIAAVRRLANTILPMVRQKFPHAQLTIVGRSPAEGVKALVDAEAVQLVADPKDLAPIYGEADVAVIPLTDGGGTRLKILEAMALGVPVVATALAAEGLDVIAGEHFVAAEADEEFADCVEKLMADSVTCNALRMNAFERVRDKYGREAISRAVTAAL